MKHNRCTDQNISKRTESVHAKLTPLVGKKSILQPLVNHGVDLLESVWRRESELSLTTQTQTLTMETKRWEVELREEEADV